jgi:hypothetical protein
MPSNPIESINNALTESERLCAVGGIDYPPVLPNETAALRCAVEALNVYAALHGDGFTAREALAKIAAILERKS